MSTVFPVAGEPDDRASACDSSAGPIATVLDRGLPNLKVDLVGTSNIVVNLGLGPLPQAEAALNRIG